MVRVVAVVRGSLLIKEVLLQIFHSSEIAEIAVTAHKGEFSLVVVSVVTVYFVPPVHVRICVRILATVQGEQFGIVVLDWQSVQSTGLVHEETIGISVRKFRGAKHSLIAVLVLCSHLQRRILSAFGSDGDNSVAAFHTVQSGSDRILEDFNLLDLDTVKVVQ